ncbi:hypothetical protein GCL60_07550 [Silvanigrella paludirubra]|uniref:Uncharacterized protein n=1 Tax=Silvanigrella paludirubra TaxID=2499159 RepID=A0A6N6VRX6_9BACT|nr:hypothetical protein [Silvanigrella paludirubra]KAB8038710.1 hypothetical protein GCL60_07550 [Silvanigrella paludirubra]
MLKEFRIFNIIFLVLSFIAMSSTYANEVIGTSKVIYKKLDALQLNGSNCSLSDNECLNFKNICNSLYGNMLQSEIILNYKINTQTNMHYGILTYQNIDIPLASAGISGEYTFLTPSIPSPLDRTIRIIFFTLDKNFENAYSFLHFRDSNTNQKYQCVLSSK